MEKLFIKNFNPQTLVDMRKFVDYTGLKYRNINMYVDFALDENQKSTRNMPLNSYTNDYIEVIRDIIDVFGKRDIEILLYGFGDADSDDSEVFALSDGIPCVDKYEAWMDYITGISSIETIGARSFIPVVSHGIESAKTKGDQIVFILTNGLPENFSDNFDAFVDSSWSDIMIMIIGIGPGPWNGVSRYIGPFEGRKFENVSFIQFSMYSSLVEFMGNVLLSLNDMLISLKKDKRKFSRNNSENESGSELSDDTGKED